MESFFSSLISWNLLPFWPFFGLDLVCSFMSLLLQLLLHTDLKWFSFPHFWHFSPYPGQFPLPCNLPQYLQFMLWLLLDLFLPWLLPLDLFLPLFMASYVMDILTPKNFCCSIFYSTLHDSNSFLPCLHVKYERPWVYGLSENCHKTPVMYKPSH